jgi:hypothetical protein
MPSSRVYPSDPDFERAKEESLIQQAKEESLIQQAIDETLRVDRLLKVRKDTNTALYNSMFDLGRSPDVAAIPYVRAKPSVTVRLDEAAIQMPESPRPRSPPKPGFFTTIGARLRKGLTRHKNRGDRYRVHSEVTPTRPRTAKVNPAPDPEFSALGKGLIMRKSKRRRRKTRKTRRRH